MRLGLHGNGTGTRVEIRTGFKSGRGLFTRLYCKLAVKYIVHVCAHVQWNPSILEWSSPSWLHFLCINQPLK